MKNDNIVALNTPAQDVLSELLKTGAQQLLTQAIEAEVATLLAQYQGQLTESGLQGVVRNGHLPERTIQTGLGDVGIKITRILKSALGNHESLTTFCKLLFQFVIPSCKLAFCFANMVKTS